MGYGTWLVLSSSSTYQPQSTSASDLTRSPRRSTQRPVPRRMWEKTSGLDGSHGKPAKQTEPSLHVRTRTWMWLGGPGPGTKWNGMEWNETAIGNGLTETKCNKIQIINYTFTYTNLQIQNYKVKKHVTVSVIIMSFTVKVSRSQSRSATQMSQA